MLIIYIRFLDIYKNKVYVLKFFIIYKLFLWVLIFCRRVLIGYYINFFRFCKSYFFFNRNMMDVVFEDFNRFKLFFEWYGSGDLV